MAAAPVHDVFISHAFEDKSDFANELAVELTKAGLKVWYSGFELKLGDSIAGSVNKALKEAAFGIVIISPIYLQKRWAMNELTALFAQEKGQNRILPILHHITVEELKEDFPILADRYTISSDKRMNYIIQKVWQAMGNAGKNLYQHDTKTGTAESNKNRVNEMKENAATHTNTNNVTVDNGSGGILILVIIIIASIAIYFFYESSGQDTPVQGAPVINKQNVKPSNSN